MRAEERRRCRGTRRCGGRWLVSTGMCACAWRANAAKDNRQAVPAARGAPKKKRALRRGFSGRALRATRVFLLAACVGSGRLAPVGRVSAESARLRRLRQRRPSCRRASAQQRRRRRQRGTAASVAAAAARQRRRPSRRVGGRVPAASAARARVGSSLGGVSSGCVGSGLGGWALLVQAVRARTPGQGRQGFCSGTWFPRRRCGCSDV